MRNEEYHMKKTYINPEMLVVKIHATQQLLAESTTVTLSDETLDDVTFGAREDDFTLDEEEEYDDFDLDE